MQEDGSLPAQGFSGGRYLERGISAVCRNLFRTGGRGRAGGRQNESGDGGSSAERLVDRRMAEAVHA